MEHEVEVTHPDKVMFPGTGITKGQIATYYRRVAPVMVPHLSGRALTTVRYPRGIGGRGFFQKDTPDHFPDWIRRGEVPKKGGTVAHTVVDRPETLLYLAQQNMITPHMALALVDDLAHPDRYTVDLDPSTDDFEPVRAMAFAVRDVLGELGLRPFVQVTGSRGVHVVVALDRSAPWAEVRRFSGALAAHLVRAHPDVLTAEFSKSERGDRIYLDLGRNGPAATMVAPYGVRAVDGAPVATPLTWEELADTRIGPRSFDIDSVPELLARRPDPWAAIDEHAAAVPAPPT